MPRGEYQVSTDRQKAMIAVLTRLTSLILNSPLAHRNDYKTDPAQQVIKRFVEIKHAGVTNIDGGQSTPLAFDTSAI